MKFSNFELEGMHVTWRDREAITADMRAKPAQERGISYATVKTIINHLQEKGAIERLRCYGRTILLQTSISC